MSNLLGTQNGIGWVSDPDFFGSMGLTSVWPGSGHHCPILLCYVQETSNIICLLEIQKISVSTSWWGMCFGMAVVGFGISTLFVSPDSSCVCTNPLILWQCNKCEFLPLRPVALENSNNADSVALIKGHQWNKIILVARCFAKASCKAINSAIVILDDDTDVGHKSFDACAHLIESDCE